MSALTIVNAKKNYGKTQALRGINLNINPGEFFGLLGPNGAGKTTLISSIVGLCRLSEGSIKVSNFDVTANYMQARSLIGYAPQDVNLDRFFSIKKILMYQAGYFGAKRSERKGIVEKLLSQFRLEEKQDLPYYRLSGGMQKRVLVAKALVGKPKVLILDEPTAGVDVEQRYELWEYLRTLNRDGTTIILTTHYIDEAEELCQRIGIINLGEIKEMGSPKDLINRYCHNRVAMTVSHKPDPSILASIPLEVAVDGNKIAATGPNTGEISQVLFEQVLKQAGQKVLDLHVERGTLEDVFLKVTGSRINN